MPQAKVVDEEAAEALGRLLLAYGESVGLTPRASIAAARRDRLREALEQQGATVSARAAGVLADGMASGQVAVTGTHVYLINDGGKGVKATCACRAGKGGCTLQTGSGSAITCLPSENSKCKTCAFSLGVSVAAVTAIARKPADLGAQFAGQLPGEFPAMIGELGSLSYPVVDRLNLHEQTERRETAARRALLGRLTFPLLTLADALDRLLSDVDGGLNLLRAAVGDYPTPTAQRLANAIGSGAVTVDDDTRTVAVRTKSKPGGVTVDVQCICWSSSERGCVLTYGKNMINCMPGTGGCPDCKIQVSIPSELLVGLSAQFVPD